MSKKVLVTNDDGYRSAGLRSLVKNIVKYADAVVVAPDGPRSAAGLSLTLYRPIRIREYTWDDVKYYAVNGTPGDCVTIGLFYLCDKNPDMVLSGINIGENLSLLEFFMSGTVAAAILASIHGIPAIAFSKREVATDVMLTHDVKSSYDEVGLIAAEITSYFLDERLPENVDLLSVNFPTELRKDVKVSITTLARVSLVSKIYARDDPRGRPYYWIWGEKLSEFPRGTDAFETVVKGNISVTPISLKSLSLDPSILSSLKGFKEYMDDFVRRSL